MTACDIHCRYNLSARADVNNVPMHTTREKLQMLRCYDRAIIPYHDFMILGIEHGMSVTGSGDYSVAIYRFDSGDRSIEGDATLIQLFDRNYDDMGDAVRDGMRYAEAEQLHELMRRAYK